MSQPPDADELRVLIVDDDPHMCLLLSRVFEKRKAVVEVCHDGNDALKKVRHFKPHLVMLDYMLPKMDGLKVLRFLKGDARLRDARVLLMTASAEDEVPREAEACGVDGFLPKPLDLPTVIATVERLLPAE
jgi:CheY-like chemotaxis protein